MKVSKILLSVFTIALASCDSGTNESTEDSFDRGAMLTNWADHIIMPAYENYLDEIEALVIATNTFNTTVNEANLASLRTQWQSAYLAWQWVAMFEIGQAETVSLQSYTNLFPTNSTEIEANITSGNYNLELPSRRDQQGFPAIDYLINGVGESEAAIVGIFSDTQTGEKYRNYLSDIVGRLNLLTTQVVDDWQNGYRETFVNNDGSSATGAVNKVANDYIYYFEKHLRASKIGIPAGVFSGTPDAKDVESYYGSSFSKALYEEALAASQAFFNGQHFESSTTGEGFNSYLDYLNSIKQGEDLTKLINDQFVTIESTGSHLSDDLSEQVETDNALMLNTYDELQKNVIHFKVDMLQALNIKVDYVDADGD
ncbi:Imelysin [Reichenbachiella faecimaris]|uniref:Imelysin n=1 Tax=Reichenbachiella faecimaris TaxID=692418 RepID=A0A1W2G5M0_REIFA|nr:imelysin family protein [Reichenbachiella faecimaris]SMD31891.1 Imelysin [Reichenbachiella faecimaris]